MRSLKQLKEIFLGVVLVAFIITGTYLASKSSVSSRHRRSPDQQNGDGSPPPLAREGKKSSELNVPNSPSNPSTQDGDVKAGLQLVNDSTSGATEANSSAVANTPSTSSLTTRSSEIASNVTSITVSTLPVNRTTTTKSIQTPLPNTTVATPTPSSTSAISKVTNITSHANQSMATTSSKKTSTSSNTTTTSKDQLLNQTFSTIASNNSYATNETLQKPSPGEGGLTPTLAAIVGLGCGLVFFVMIYAVFRLVKNFKTFRFRRLHEMPMDDFDDYSGVYVEHTVPIRG